MTKFSLPAVLLGLVTLSAVALGQEPAPAFAGDPRASAELAKIVETTQAKGLPIDPILAKARYALVVHASPERIVTVARSIAARLEIARDALAPHPSPDDIAQGEVALSYNVPRDVLTAVRRATPPDSSVAVPLGALAQLVASGVSVKRASEIVTSLIKRGISSRQLASISNDVDSDVRLGSRPDEALDVRVRGLTAALAPASVGAVQAATAGILTAPPGKPKP